MAPFSGLAQFSIHSLSEYQDRLVPYLKARGVQDEAVKESYAQRDLLQLADALNLYFEQDSTLVLQEFMGEHFSLIERSHYPIDHIGRELFGPLSFYLPLLKQTTPKLGLIYLGELLFPSRSVVKALQKYDSTLQGVTIGRVYFESMKNGKKGCLELFQPSPKEEAGPQSIEWSERRRGGEDTIDHLSIRLNRVEEVLNLHQRIYELKSETILPVMREVSYNSSDGSLHTKALIKNARSSPSNKIIEFVHYDRF